MRNAVKAMIYGGLVAIAGATSFGLNVQAIRESERPETIRYRSQSAKVTEDSSIYRGFAILTGFTTAVAAMTAWYGYDANKEYKEFMRKNPSYQRSMGED